MNAPTQWSLKCARCLEEFGWGPMSNGCPECRQRGAAGVVEAWFRPEVTPPPPSPCLGPGRDRRHHRLLPGYTDEWLSLGEGGTPLVRSTAIGPRLGLPRLYFKNETANPTWSFKDRYAAVSINLARSFGFTRVVVSSTGNLGVSVAAYGAACALECLVLILAGTSPGIVDQIRLHGARLATVAPEERQRVFEQIAGRREWFPVGLFLPRPVQSPFGIEGYRAIAYEIIEALGEVPGAMLFPCARGNGLYGAWKGFVEAERWGWVTGKPAMFACQPLGANSLEVSLRQGASQPVELPRIASAAFSASETVADARALEALRRSGGDACSANDAQVLAAVRDLAGEGLYVEPAAALPVACLPELLRRGAVDPARALVCVLTGAGVKWPQPGGAPGSLPHLDPRESTIARFLGGG